MRAKDLTAQTHARNQKFLSVLEGISRPSSKASDSYDVLWN